MSPLPADLDLVTVRGRYVRLDGTPVAGTVEFSTTNVLTDPASLTTIVPATILAPLDAAGAFSIDLPASDDPDVTPTGWTYSVRENFTGGRPTYSITVPAAAKATGVDLAVVSPVPASAGTSTQAFVLMGAFTALAARVTALESAPPADTGGTTTTTTGFW